MMHTYTQTHTDTHTTHTGTHIDTHPGMGCTQTHTHTHTHTHTDTHMALRSSFFLLIDRYSTGMVCTSQGTIKNGVCILPREERPSEFQYYEFGVLCLILVSSGN